MDRVVSLLGVDLSTYPLTDCMSLKFVGVLLGLPG